MPPAAARCSLVASLFVGLLISLVNLAIWTAVGLAWWKLLGLW